MLDPGKKDDDNIIFNENEKILCYQGPFIYEAKCLKSATEIDGKFLYYVHYNGWNKSHDEWVSKERMLKLTDDNILKQKQLIEQYRKEKAKRTYTKSNKTKPEKEKDTTNKIKLEKEGSTAKVVAKQEPLVIVEKLTPVNVESTVLSKRKKTVETIEVCDIEEVDPYETSLKRSLHFTLPLKNVLSDDWDFIMRQKRVPHLPARITVENIIINFLKNKQSLLSPERFSNVKYAFSGMTELFNVMLGSKLLYKFERPQFGDMLDLYPKHTPCQIYGFPHFLRFFVQLQKQLWEASANDNNIDKIIVHSQDCIDYLDEIAAVTYSWLDYDTVPAEYHRRAIT